MSEISRRSVELAPLSPELSPQVMAWSTELRAQFTALGMSISLFCRLHPVDKGTVSRYLNGKRVPADRWFLDQVLALRSSAGTPVTDEVRTHLVDLQMTALKVAHPHEYRVRRVSDQLEIAVTSWREAERYAQTLEQELAERTRSLQDSLTETSRLRTAWDEDRTRYQQEVMSLTRQLELARDRARQAEHRVHVLEELLDQLETQQPSASSFAKDINPDDPRAVAGLLDSLRRAGAEGQIEMLIAQLSAPSLDMRDPYEVTGLLDALRRVGADEQIAVLVERIPELHIDQPYTMAKLLDVLRRVGAKKQIAMLLEGIPSLLNSVKGASSLIDLLDALRRVGAEKQIAMLVERVPYIRLPNWYFVTKLLDALRRAGADEQIAVLAERIPDLPLDMQHASEAADLLDALEKVGANKQIARLVDHVLNIPLGHPTAMAALFGALHRAEGAVQIRELAKRVATTISLDSPQSLATLLHYMEWAGAADQCAILAERASLGVSLDYTEAAEYLMHVMEDIGVDASAKALAERIAIAKGPDSEL